MTSIFEYNLNIPSTYHKHAFIWGFFFNTLQSGCYNHYFFFFRKYAKISFSVSFWRNQIDFIKLFLVKSLVVWRWPPILSEPYRCKQKEGCFNNNPFWLEAVTYNLLVASNELGSSVLKLFIRYVILIHIFVCRLRGRVIFFCLLVVLNVPLFYFRKQKISFKNVLEITISWIVSCSFLKDLEMYLYNAFLPKTAVHGYIYSTKSICVSCVIKNWSSSRP